MRALEVRLRTALKVAMKSHDPIATSAIRSALAAIDNAGSIPLGDRVRPATSRRIAGSVQGLGAGEAARRELGEVQISEIVRAEITDRMQAAAQYESLGRTEAAARLRDEGQVLRGLLSSDGAGQPSTS